MSHPVSLYTALRRGAPAMRDSDAPSRCSRRDFLRTGTAIALGSSIAGVCAPPADAPFDGRRAVNPAIDNLSVVCGLNPRMIANDPVAWDMDAQNAVVVAAEVEKTLDAMAIALTKQNAPDAAWGVIFQKPQDKEWKTVKAAIKVNCIALNHPRLAVVNKLCVELLRLGMRPENIVIYDGCHNAAPLYASFVGNGLPAGVIVSDKSRALGGTVKTPIPEPHKGNYSCTAALADGTVDLLVNVAVNKGHRNDYGGTTLTMKNHAGTFDPKPLHLGGGMDYLIAFNKSDAIRGKRLPRQQLCIVDSLWGAKSGPGGAPEKRLNRLVMGTLSPVVDYLTAKKIREPELGAAHGDIERFVTEFGYRVEEIPPLTMVTV